VNRRNADELFLVRIVAKPSPQNSEANEAGGAYVNCRVNADNLRTAERIAVDRIREEQWEPVKFDHWEIVCERCYTEDAKYNETDRKEYLERVREAFEYGIALVFNCWPKDAPDANDEYL
ncbi:MAG TPA: hypothetical protein VHH73_15545, partial [Verrucomicrobiae bacterium]|nr:hypothetical protein [Verrucomicrobiae bacterium]